MMPLRGRMDEELLVCGRRDEVTAGIAGGERT
jgi:hypothetical protein